MATETEIANLALQYLGEYSIIDLAATDPTTVTIRVAYPQARDEVLDSSRWAEAKKPGQLSKLSDKPLFKWAAAYQLPADWLRPVEIEGCSAWLPIPDFDRMGQQLMIGPDWDEDELPDFLNVIYIGRLEDTSQMSPLLIECIALKLAIKVCRKITGSDNKAQALMKEYEQVVFPKAQTRDAQARYAGQSNNPLRQMLRMSTQGRARWAGF